MTELHRSSSDRPTRQSQDRLDSWKEIARYLKRDESTVQRWEKREGMPVHRHLHDKRGSVYAFRAELDAWWQSRRQQLEDKKPAGESSAAAAIAKPRLRGRRAWWIGGVAVAVLIAAGVLSVSWLPRASTSNGSAIPKLVRLTSASGVNIDPALSPDGSMLAYASDRDGGSDLDIWVQPTRGGEPTRLTDGASDETEPSFSPDGAFVVFAQGETGGIYVVETAGGEPRLLAAAARAHTPRFSPDGKWVTFWTGLPTWAVSRTTTASGTPFIVPAHGGAPRALAPNFDDARHPVWAPDSETILFLGLVGSGDDALLDWYLVDRNGGEPARTNAVDVLRQAGVGGVPIPSGWNGDGVVFATYDAGASNVWQVALSTSTKRVVGTPVRLTFGTAIERSPSVGGSGRIAFASVVENVDIWRVPLDPRTGLARGAIERVTDNAANDRLLNLSDDGETMAFVSTRTGRNEIWIRDLPPGRERQITFSHAPDGRISHDGSTIAVGRGASDQPGIDLMSVTGGSARALCDDCFPGNWSPDDARLVFRKGQSQLFVHQGQPGRTIELASHPTWALNQPRFSPDGRWVAFHTANSPSLRQIYAVPTFGHTPVPFERWVPVVTDFGLQASWSSNGDGIYHFSLRDGAFCAWLQPVDPDTKRPVGPPLAVEHFHQPRLRAASGAMATNDVAAGYLYVTLTETAANIWMLER